MKLNKSLSVAAIATVMSGASLLPLVLHSARAQSNPVMTNVVPESASVTVHAKITAIDPATRSVTLVGASGTAMSVTAGPAVRLEMLKVGQTVNAQYYRSVGFVVNPPAGGNGVPTSDDQMAQMMAQPANAPGGAAVRLTKVSGTVVGINMGEHSIDVINPSGGGVYTLAVTDPARIAMLGTLKVGDTITAVVSQALAVMIDPAPKSWF